MDSPTRRAHRLVHVWRNAKIGEHSAVKCTDHDFLDFCASTHTTIGKSLSFSSEWPVLSYSGQLSKLPTMHARLPHDPVIILPGSKPHSSSRNLMPSSVQRVQSSGSLWTLIING